MPNPGISIDCEAKLKASPRASQERSLIALRNITFSAGDLTNVQVVGAENTGDAGVAQAAGRRAESVGDIGHEMPGRVERDRRAQAGERGAIEGARRAAVRMEGWILSIWACMAFVRWMVRGKCWQSLMPPGRGVPLWAAVDD
jgi:hypothetical protein